MESFRIKSAIFKLSCLIFFINTGFLSFSGFSQKSPVVVGKEVITPQLIQDYVDFLASDSLKGRNTPSPGLDSAAVYLAGNFRRFGLQPLNGTYFQELDYCIMHLGNGNHLFIKSNEKTQEFAIKTDYVPYEMTADREVSGEVVFAGYGITAPEYNYDDYQKIDARGKIVLIMRQEPGQTDTTSSLFLGSELSKYANLKEKIKNAMAHGAVGMIVVNGPLNFNSLRPRGYPWPSLSKVLPQDALPLQHCGSPEKKIPIVHAGEMVIRALLFSVDSLKHLQKRIDLTHEPLSFPLTGKMATLKTSVSETAMGGKNVFGYLEGNDPLLKRELLVVGAHYDHVGYMEHHKADTDYIYNGADDNASGTSGVLATAKAFSMMGMKPKRSVLFILFAGEEKGLLGSSTYTRKPLFPLEETVCMINLDMISRNSPDTLYLIGKQQSPELAEIIIGENKNTGFILVDENKGEMSGGSDHYNFFRKGIPVMFFFTNLHDDYHEVTDNPDSIDALKASKVAQLVFLASWRIANDNQRYKIMKTEEKASSTE